MVPVSSVYVQNRQRCFLAFASALVQGNMFSILTTGVYRRSIEPRASCVLAENFCVYVPVVSRFVDTLLEFCQINRMEKVYVMGVCVRVESG